MPKLSENMYGADDNAFAASIASDALTPTSGEPYTWGPLLQDKAEAKGNGTDPSEVVVTHNRADSRAKTQGNHGTQD